MVVILAAAAGPTRCAVPAGWMGTAGWIRPTGWFRAAGCILAARWAQAGKQEDPPPVIRPASPPREGVLSTALADGIATSDGFSILDATTGARMGTVWPRAALATAAAVDGGGREGNRGKEAAGASDAPGRLPATGPYDRLAEGTLLGVLRLADEGQDARGQVLLPGVYTMRFARQPVDGDHLGASAHPEFVVLSLVSEDTDAGLVARKTLLERSRQVSGAPHPAVLALLPPPDGALDLPRGITQGALDGVVFTIPPPAPVDPRASPPPPSSSSAETTAEEPSPDTLASPPQASLPVALILRGVSATNPF